MQSALDSAFSKPFSARETDGLRILCDVRRRVAQDAPFDAAIDRYILPHQLDPVPERIAPGKPQQNGRLEWLHLTLLPDTATPPIYLLRQQRQRFAAFNRSPIL